MADEPTLATGPHHATRADMPWIPLHKTWQMNLLWQMDPLVPEQRCLEYQYTKLGRWTYFGRWMPQEIKNRYLEYCYTKLGRWTFFGQWPPSTRAEMTCIPLHKTWQMNLLWQMDPLVPEQRCLEYQYTKLGRWTYFGQWTPPCYQSRDALNTSTPNLADEPTLADGCPRKSRIDTLNTATPNLADEPSLANDPPVPEQRWLAYHYTKLGRWTYFGRWTP